MDITMIAVLGLVGPIFILIGLVVAKMIAGKALPSSEYTPFDHITGQTSVEFQEQKQEKEEDDEQGDDKDKHKPRDEKRND